MPTDSALGLNFGVANILAGLFFGIIGFAAFRYGKKQSLLKPMIVGGLLMAYPYFVSNTIAVFLVGAALTLSLFIFN